MSRKFWILLFLVLAVGGGLAWYLTRPKPGELDVAANQLPELPPARIAIGDWPWWRGPTRDNHSPDSEAPTKWSETENIVWKTFIPGRGHSTPIFVGTRIFLTSADEQVERQFVVCLDRTTGATLWDKTIHEKNFPHKHHDNTHASGTPASDGERLFVVFANNSAIWVTALDLDGKEILWQKEAGPQKDTQSSFGSGSSLALWGSHVFICDNSPSGLGWIAGLYRTTGELWRTGHRTGIGSYGTVTIAELNGKACLIHAGNDKVTACDPTTGKIIWERGGFGETSANTAAFSPNMVFASTGVGRILFALHADGSLAWKKGNSDAIPYPSSMLWVNGYLYATSDNGMATCFDTSNGEEKWKVRLRGGYYSSPLLIGNNIYACNRDGLTTIFEASPAGYNEVGRNKIDGGINASPVAVGGKLYIRTETHLYCIGKK